MPTRRLLLASSVLTALFVACSGSDSDSPAVSGESDAAADVTTSSTPDSSSGSDASGGSDSTAATDADLDAAVEEDGGLITDGGGNPDEPLDGGTTDAGDAGADASVDAGVCGPPAGNGPNLTSQCASSSVLPSGGTIATGTYDLEVLTVLGSVPYCSTYTPAQYAGRLDVTAKAGGGFTFDERVVRVGLFRPQPRGYDVTVVGKTVSVNQTCGVAITQKSWGYSAGVNKGGKATLVYAHDTGTSTVRYRWVHR